LVDISIVAGREPDKIRALIRRVHTAVRESLDVPAETIRVIVREVPPEHWAVGGVTKGERP
jgi:4-oxalocrotonate tautomerase